MAEEKKVVRVYQSRHREKAITGSLLSLVRPLSFEGGYL